MAGESLKIPFFLITGFLGSGKTTFIKRLLKQYGERHKIGVIQNEYASANIDTVELHSTGKPFKVLEVNKGSVFCICLLANFVDSMAAFIDEFNPETIFLESSGLSDPIAIAELMQHDALKDKLYLAHVWCILDASNYLKVSKMSERLKRQIRISDTIIINKLDKGEENLDIIRDEIIQLNSHADVLESSYCTIHLDDNIFNHPKETVAFLRESEHKSIAPFGQADIETVVLRTTSKISYVQLQQFISEVEGKVIRMKGFVNLIDGKNVKIQSEFGQTEIMDYSDYLGPTELIGIGYGISPKQFGRRFHEIRKGN